MRPFFAVGEHAIPAYPCVLVAAILVGLALLRVEVVRLGRSPRDAFAIAITGSLAGAFGARAWSVWFESSSSATLLDALLHGGLSVLGGVLGGCVGGAVVARARGLDAAAFIDVLDMAAPAIAIAIGIGRVGCLLAGCCYGSPTLFPIALIFADYDAAARPLGVPLHATQIYELVSCVLLGAGLLRWRSYRRGQRFVLLVFSYGALRFMLEFLRADPRGEVLGWPATQFACACFVLVTTPAVTAMFMSMATRPTGAT